MNLFLEVLVVFCQFFKAMFIAFIRFFIPREEKNVENELVLITGAGSGLGRQMCVEFCRRGATVIACDINNQGLDETAEMVKAHGQGKGKINTYICDVSSREKIYEFADKVRNQIGHPTILVNNAGIVSGKHLLDIPDHMVQKTIDVNLMAHIWTVKAFLPHMTEQNHGHIVNVASIAGIVGTTRMTDYCASKFGDVGFTESLMYELEALGKTGVKTTIVCPYFINTGMFAGCKTRFNSILPVLDPQETVAAIMQAVLTNQQVLYVPRLMYFLVWVGTMLPINANIVLHRFSGAMSLMDTFQGRQAQELNEKSD